MTGSCAAAMVGQSSSLSADISPASATGYGNSGAAANITTNAVTAKPTGGVAPYSYAWAQKTTGSYTWTIGSAAAATTSFTGQTVAPGTADQVTFEVTVTDATGAKGKATVDAVVNNGIPYDPRDRRDIGGGL